MDDKPIIIIAIDGPSGAGKSTVARQVAHRLGFIYADTGKFYRALALGVLRLGTDINDESEVANTIAQLSIDFTFDDDEFRVLLDGEDVTDDLGATEVGETASAISTFSAVRATLLELQRSTARSPGVVMDGRDIGTVVFPDTPHKVFVDATPETRAKRRLVELIELGEFIDFDTVLNDMRKRDIRDRNREIAPLKQADDALYIDTSELTIEQVVDRIIEKVSG